VCSGCDTVNYMNLHHCVVNRYNSCCKLYTTSHSFVQKFRNTKVYFVTVVTPRDVDYRIFTSALLPSREGGCVLSLCVCLSDGKITVELNIQISVFLHNFKKLRTGFELLTRRGPKEQLIFDGESASRSGFSNYLKNSLSTTAIPVDSQE